MDYSPDGFQVLAPDPGLGASFDSQLARRYAQDERFMDYRLIGLIDYSPDWIN